MYTKSEMCDSMEKNNTLLEKSIQLLILYLFEESTDLLLLNLNFHCFQSKLLMDVTATHSHFLDKVTKPIMASLKEKILYS